MAKTTMDSLDTSPDNQQVRCLTNAGVVPDWFPGIQTIWIHAMSHVSRLGLAPQESPSHFGLPPIHLFWGGEPENQHIYHYHYLVLFNEIKNWPKCNLLALTTQEWRSILGNTYWKKQWPKHNTNNPSLWPQHILEVWGPSPFWLLMKYQCCCGLCQPHKSTALPLSCPALHSRWHWHLLGSFILHLNLSLPLFPCFLTPLIVVHLSTTQSVMVCTQESYLSVMTTWVRGN